MWSMIQERSVFKFRSKLKCLLEAFIFMQVGGLVASVSCWLLDGSYFQQLSVWPSSYGSTQHDSLLLWSLQGRVSFSNTDITIVCDVITCNNHIHPFTFAIFLFIRSKSQILLTLKVRGLHTEVNFLRSDHGEHHIGLPQIIIWIKKIV